MSNDLATIATQLPAHLRAHKPVSEEFSGGIGASFPLPFLSVRGKEFRLRKDGHELNTNQRELDVVLVAARPTLSKRYYATKYASGSIEAPDCSSRDSLKPDVAKPVAPDCRHCPKNQWGSRITDNGKEGKACQDYKRIVLWAVGLTDEPLVLDVPATSLKAPKGQRNDGVLMLGDYLGQLAKHGMDPTTVVTKVSFTSAEYPQLHFNFARFVDEGEYAKVLELRQHDDVRSVIDEDRFEGGGDSKPEQGGQQNASAGAPDPTPTSAPSQESPNVPSDEIPPYPGGTVVLKNASGGLKLAEDEASYCKAWASGYRPVDVGGSAPAEEPKVEEPKVEEPKVEEPKVEEPKVEEPDAGDDLLSKVAALLKS